MFSCLFIARLYNLLWLGCTQHEIQLNYVTIIETYPEFYTVNEC